MQKACRILVHEFRGSALAADTRLAPIRFIKSDPPVGPAAAALPLAALRTRPVQEAIKVRRDSNNWIARAGHGRHRAAPHAGFVSQIGNSPCRRHRLRRGLIFGVRSGGLQRAGPLRFHPGGLGQAGYRFDHVLGRLAPQRLRSALWREPQRARCQRVEQRIRQGPGVFRGGASSARRRGQRAYFRHFRDRPDPDPTRTGTTLRALHPLHTEAHHINKCSPALSPPRVT